MTNPDVVTDIDQNRRDLDEHVTLVSDLMEERDSLRAQLETAQTSFWAEANLRATMQAERDAAQASYDTLLAQRDREYVEAQALRAQLVKQKALAEKALARVADIEARTKWEANGAPQSGEPATRDRCAHLVEVGAACEWCSGGTAHQ